MRFFDEAVEVGERCWWGLSYAGSCNQPADPLKTACGDGGAVYRYLGVGLATYALQIDPGTGDAIVVDPVTSPSSPTRRTWRTATPSSCRSTGPGRTAGRGVPLPRHRRRGPRPRPDGGRLLRRRALGAHDRRHRPRACGLHRHDALAEADRRRQQRQRRGLLPRHRQLHELRRALRRRPPRLQRPPHRRRRGLRHADVDAASVHVTALDDAMLLADAQINVSASGGSFYGTGTVLAGSGQLVTNVVLAGASALVYDASLTTTGPTSDYTTTDTPSQLVAGDRVEVGRRRLRVSRADARASICRRWTTAPRTGRCSRRGRRPTTRATTAREARRRRRRRGARRPGRGEGLRVRRPDHHGGDRPHDTAQDYTDTELWAKVPDVLVSATSTAGIDATILNSGVERRRRVRVHARVQLDRLQGAELPLQRDRRAARRPADLEALGGERRPRRSPGSSTRRSTRAATSPRRRRTRRRSTRRSRTLPARSASAMWGATGKSDRRHARLEQGLEPRLATIDGSTVTADGDLARRRLRRRRHLREREARLLVDHDEQRRRERPPGRDRQLRPGRLPELRGHADLVFGDRVRLASDYGIGRRPRPPTCRRCRTSTSSPATSSSCTTATAPTASRPRRGSAC